MNILLKAMRKEVSRFTLETFYLRCAIILSMTLPNMEETYNDVDIFFVLYKKKELNTVSLLP